MHPLFSAEAPVDHWGRTMQTIFLPTKKEMKPTTTWYSQQKIYQVLSGHVRFRTNAGMTMGITMSFM
jgi:hypothetical protein